ncbi:hypothetical protein A9Q79_02710 [Methylophaga sp. 42_25_T18]|nr:hypothetical protein A9Q79_02710 [Methylophaga sp. 42_25_T18]
MKQIYALALSLVSVVTFADVTNSGQHLFILSGQSNMARLEPSKVFIPTLIKEFGESNIIIVKEASGGLSIQHWKKNWPPQNQNIYLRLITLINQAIKNKSIQTVTFVWMQGERDAKEGYGSMYSDNLKELLKQLQIDLGHKNINFVLGRLSDFGLNNPNFPHWNLIRSSQTEIAENSPYGAWVNTDDLNDGFNLEGVSIKNDLHYSVEGYNTFGKRLAEKSIELISRQTQ